jgi:hypothetical protein
VPVVFVMAGIAFLRHTLRPGRLAMAVGALQFAVCAEQREVRVARMIEHPQPPAVRRVAGFAFFAQAAFMHILVRMAILARRGRTAESLSGMTLHAADDAMQPQQGKLRQIMIEFAVCAPGILTMAIGAFAGHLAGVRIFAAVAAFAIFRQLCTRIGSVTGMAVEFRVRALQRKFMPRDMIVDNRMPLVVVVAILALRAEAPRVGVVGAVTAIAILRNFLLVVAAAMAG